jgi:hypothetical protein
MEVRKGFICKEINPMIFAQYINIYPAFDAVPANISILNVHKKIAIEAEIYRSGAY